MNDLIARLHAVGIVPVVKIEHAKDAVPLAEALKKGGSACAEITFRTDAAEDAIRAIHAAFPDFLIGAGTVLTEEQADRAMNAGASFIVCPGLDEDLVRYCMGKGYPIIPGVSTASEVARGLRLGLTYLKFFPAEQAGGVAMIKALAAPYRDVRFMPTGGVNTKNMADYLQCKAVFACGGSWVVPPDAITGGDFGRIEKLIAETNAKRKELL